MNDEVIYPCPFCGEELADKDEFWRQIHINGCAPQQNTKKESSSKCCLESCPICRMKLDHFTVDFATAHINHCMDNQTLIKSSKKKTERCPFCGQNIKDMNERQRKIHDQTCRQNEKLHEQVDVIRYPKVVEDTPTPAEWETETSFEPMVVNPKNSDRKVVQLLPIFGRIMSMPELQEFSGYSFSNTLNSFCLEA